MNRYYDIFPNARPISTHLETEDEEKKETRRRKRRKEEEKMMREEKKEDEEEEDMFYTPIKYTRGEVRELRI